MIFLFFPIAFGHNLGQVHQKCISCCAMAPRRFIFALSTLCSHNMQEAMGISHSKVTIMIAFKKVVHRSAKCCFNEGLGFH